MPRDALAASAAAHASRRATFAAVLALPVILALWFAPALVVFQDCGATEALALSLRASIA